ncbi:MAG: hypothetical protein AB1568_06850 [Thermodesulfobacteriota bacterium]
MLTPRTFFDTIPSRLAPLFDRDLPVWEALRRLPSFLEQQAGEQIPRSLCSGRGLTDHVVLHQGRIVMEPTDIVFDDATKGRLLVSSGGILLEGATVIMAGAVLIGNGIVLGRGVLVESGAMIKGPVWIGDCTEIRQGAYVRGNCATGDRCVLGHTTEIKNTIFLDDAKAGHFAYLGDSILGNRVNLGAGTKLANLRFVPGTVSVKTSDSSVDTGLRKLGAIMGDDVQTGCNSVTNPGTLLQPRCMLFPNTTSPSGVHRKGSMIR